MEVIGSFVIPRHAVRNCGDGSGLSVMQRRLADSTAKIRMVSAPTGAGKSHVYRNIALDGGRILFVVPTRRLAENLVRDSRLDIAKHLVETGETISDAAKRAELLVDFWNSDKTVQLKEERGELYCVDGHYRGQVRGFQRIIYATPEMLSRIMMQPSFASYVGSVGPHTVAASFDRVVFDESHLIDHRMFSFAAACVRLAAAGAFGGRLTVDFLSATPIDMTDVLRKLDVPDDCVEHIEEELCDPDEGRVLHGDVEVRFVRAERLVDLVKSLPDRLRQERAEENRSLVIYDSLAKLQGEEDDLRDSLSAFGMTEDELLFDSSLHSQRKQDGSAGRDKTFADRYLGISTSTVEVGVTIPNLTTLIMDAGQSPLSCLQRVGRPGRGDYGALVIIRVDESEMGRKPWLHHLVEKAKELAGKPFEVTDLAEFMSGLARFGRPTSDSGKIAYGTLSGRSVYSAGLFWLAMHEKWKVRASEIAEGLLKASPIRAVNRARRAIMENDSIFRNRGGHSPWVSTMLKSVAILRDIPPSITVIDGVGETYSLSGQWLERHTKIPSMFPMTFDDRGNPVYRIDRKFSDYTLDRANRVIQTRRVMMPDGSEREIPCRNIIDSYVEACGNLSKVYDPDTGDAIEESGKLVRDSGVVPYCDLDGGGN